MQKNVVLLSFATVAVIFNKNVTIYSVEGFN